MTPLQWKRLFYRLIIWAVLLVATFLVYTVGSATWRVFTKGQDARSAHMNAEENVNDLMERKALVEAKLNKLGTEEGFEAEVRDRYQLAKPGEEVIVLVNAQSDSKVSTTRKTGFWETVTGWFRR